MGDRPQTIDEGDWDNAAWQSWNYSLHQIRVFSLPLSAVYIKLAIEILKLTFHSMRGLQRCQGAGLRHFIHDSTEGIAVYIFRSDMLSSKKQLKPFSSARRQTFRYNYLQHTLFDCWILYEILQHPRDMDENHIWCQTNAAGAKRGMHTRSSVVATRLKRLTFRAAWSELAAVASITTTSLSGPCWLLNKSVMALCNCRSMSRSIHKATACLHAVLLALPQLWSAADTFGTQSTQWRWAFSTLIYFWKWC